MSPIQPAEFDKIVEESDSDILLEMTLICTSKLIAKMQAIYDSPKSYSTERNAAMRVIQDTIVFRDELEIERQSLPKSS